MRGRSAERQGRCGRPSRTPWQGQDRPQGRVGRLHRGGRCFRHERRRPGRWQVRSQQGQALVETALVLPLLLLLAFGVVGATRLTQAQIEVNAVAREAARAATQASGAADAGSRGLARGQAVATGYGLTNGSLRLTLDPGDFSRGALVRATVTYEVQLDDLPLLGWARVTVRAAHTERVDLYRSRWPAGATP